MLLQYCELSTRSCTGAAARGRCDPQGMVCLNYDCYDAAGEDPDPYELCGWSFYVSCAGPGAENEWCVVKVGDYVAYECRPACQLVFYNHCACACEVDPGWTESGCATWCTTYKWDPCAP